MEWRKQVMAELEKCLQENGVRTESAGELLQFVIEGIGNRKEWKALGQALFVPYTSAGEEEEIFQIYMTVAQNVDSGKKEQLAVKLMELNDGALFGRFGMNGMGQIFYQTRFPIVGQDLPMVKKTFEFVLFEMVTFLDAFYAYLLVIINEPEKLTLARYTELMLTEEDGTDEEE